MGLEGKGRIQSGSDWGGSPVREFRGEEGLSQSSEGAWGPVWPHALKSCSAQEGIKPVGRELLTSQSTALMLRLVMSNPKWFPQLGQLYLKSHTWGSSLGGES